MLEKGLKMISGRDGVLEPHSFFRGNDFCVQKRTKTYVREPKRVTCDPNEVYFAWYLCTDCCSYLSAPCTFFRNVKKWNIKRNMSILPRALKNSRSPVLGPDPPGA